MAAALGALALLVLVQLVIPVLSHSRRGSARVELMQAAMLATQRLADDLQTAPVQGVTLLAPDRLSVQPVNAVTDTGVALYEARVLVFRVDGRSLIRDTFEGPELSRQHLADPAFLQQLLNRPPTRSQALVQNLVRRFEVSLGDSHNPVHLRLELQHGEDDSLRFEHQEDVFLRNSDS